MSDALLKVERLNAGYGEMAVLRDITLEIQRGEIVALVGSNGARDERSTGLPRIRFSVCVSCRCRKAASFLIKCR